MRVRVRHQYPQANPERVGVPGLMLQTEAREGLPDLCPACVFQVLTHSTCAEGQHPTSAIFQSAGHSEVSASRGAWSHSNIMEPRGGGLSCLTSHGYTLTLWGHHPLGSSFTCMFSGKHQSKPWRIYNMQAPCHLPDRSLQCTQEGWLGQGWEDLGPNYTAMCTLRTTESQRLCYVHSRLILPTSL